MIQVLIKVAASLFLLMGMFWALLPCGFGVSNYVKAHNPVLGLIARISWLVLLAVHPLLIYLIWFESVSYWLLLLLVAAHILFLSLFGRDLSTTN